MLDTLRMRGGVFTSMTCKEFANSLTEYMEHALPARRLAEFDEHRTGCVNCQTYFDQMNQLVSAAPLLRHKTGEVKVPANLYELLAKKTGAASAKLQPRKLSYQRFLIVGAVAVILAGGWLYMSRRRAMLRPEPVTIDLTERGHERGLEQPSRPPLMLPRAILDLTVKLPISAEPGNYQLGIASEESKPFFVVSGSAVSINHVTTLRVKLDLRRVPSGSYRFAVRPVSWGWAYYRLRIK